VLKVASIGIKELTLRRVPNFESGISFRNSFYDSKSIDNSA